MKGTRDHEGIHCRGFLCATSCPSWFCFGFRLNLWHHLTFGFIDFPFPLCENPPKRPLCGGKGAQFSELKQPLSAGEFHTQ